MVLEVFESARRPTCHVTAGLRHVRRLESAHTPIKAPPCARGADSQKKKIVFNARSAVFWRLGMFLRTYGNMPHDRFLGVDQNPKPHARPPPKTADLQKTNKKKTPGGIELTTIRRPQQITMSSETMGLTVPLKNPHIPPTPYCSL